MGVRVWLGFAAFLILLPVSLPALVLVRGWPTGKGAGFLILLWPVVTAAWLAVIAAARAGGLGRVLELLVVVAVLGATAVLVAWTTIGVGLLLTCASRRLRRRDRTPPP